MSEAYLSEIRLMSFVFPPKGWFECNGQILAINQNQALFSLLGTNYGGNGTTTFALPDLRGRVPIHAGAGFSQGAATGEEFHALTTGELPAHSHVLRGSSANGDLAVVAGHLLAGVDGGYHPAADLTQLEPLSLAPVGGSGAHENRHPFLTLAWCICAAGIFPSRS